MTKKSKRVAFEFEPRDLAALKNMVESNHVDGHWIEIEHPDTGERRKVFIPDLDSIRCPNCGRSY